MTTPVRVCFWATSFQSDIYAMAEVWAGDPGFDVTVAMDNPEGFAGQPIARLRPLEATFVARDALDASFSARGAEPFDLLVVDNHLPRKVLARQVLVLWHGYGWRLDDLSTMKKELSRLVGRVDRPNPLFRWVAFGPLDHEHRVRHSGLHPDSVVALGSAYSDLLVPGSPDRPRGLSELAELWAPLVPGRPTVLVAMTWHHGGLFSPWGDDRELIPALSAAISEQGGQVILRMHDRHRYEPSYLEGLEAAVAVAPSVVMKFKSDAPDSLLDLWRSSVMVSNYSSILNHFYFTEQTAIHVDQSGGAATQASYVLRRGKPRRRMLAASEIWKIPPDDVGGPIVRSFDELLRVTRAAIASPGLGAASARAFVQRHVTDPSGATRARISAYVTAWLSEAGS